MTIPPLIQTCIKTWLPVHAHHLISEAASLETDLRLDALAPLDLSEALREHFGQEVPDAVIERWETVGDVCRTYREMVGEVQAA